MFKQSSVARRLTVDNAAQHKRLDAMKALGDEFSQVAQGLIKARREVLAGSLSMDDFIGRFKQGKDKAAIGKADEKICGGPKLRPKD